ncbi:uncharacterized protein LOC123720917 isoform X2 [Papilio machaon]|uniref:uncharacterized protein LOC123721874 isoform X2 n=1 Tax=Papilio machaon TaxID=76193 RepID=UPI001E6635CF|nr:uncharacterized protein LOC123721874 isoform X2 [Papilio machaon]XP_045542127.1 uncharacterized protein LOC123720917 isoform X2 [Papilio machaon]
MTDDKLTKLKQKRGCIKTKVTIFSKYLKQLVSGGQPSKLQLLDLEGRFKKFDALYAHFDNLQCEIEMLSDDPSVSELEREEFEAGYHPLVAEARRLLGAQPQDTSVIQLEDAQGEAQKHHVRQWDKLRRHFQRAGSISGSVRP